MPVSWNMHPGLFVSLVLFCCLTKRRNVVSFFFFVKRGQKEGTTIYNNKKAINQASMSVYIIIIE